MNSSSTIKIRPAGEYDAHSIAMVHVTSWQKTYRGHIPDELLDNLSITEHEERWYKLIKSHVKVFVIERDNLIVGFASLCPSRDKDTDPTQCGEISAIYLHPDVWHQGLEKKLCNRIFLELEKMEFKEAII